MRGIGAPKGYIMAEGVENVKKKEQSDDYMYNGNGERIQWGIQEGRGYEVLYLDLKKVNFA